MRPGAEEVWLKVMLSVCSADALHALSLCGSWRRQGYVGDQLVLS